MADLQQRLLERRQGTAPPTPEAGTLDLPSRLERRREMLSREEAGVRAGAVVETGRDPGPLGPPGLEDTALRADIGLSDTFAEKRNKFMEKYPSGDFIRAPVPGGDEALLFRKNQYEPFAKVDPGILEKFELVGDLADLTGDMPAIAAEAFLTKGGGRIVPQMFRVFTGSVVGDAAKEAVEEFRGYQKELWEQQAARIATRGAVGAAGAGATVVVTGPLNMLRGSANIRVAPGAGKAQQAAKEMEIPPLMPGQIAQSPMIRKLQGQAGATVSSIKEYIQNQQRASVNALARLRDSDRARFLKGELRELHEDARKQVIQSARVNDRRFSDGGRAIQSGIAEYDDLATAAVNRAYMNARNVETPEFDITPALTIADEIDAGIRGLSEEGADIRLSKVGEDVSSVVDDLRSLDPSLPPAELPNGGISDATEQLRALRQRLWDAKTPPPGEPMRQEHAQAAKLYGAITHVLHNPRNANDDFVRAWSEANGLASRRFNTLEKLMVIRAQRDETPALLASRLAQPMQVDNLVLLRATLPKKRWEDFRDAVKTDFVAPNRVDGLTARLDSFDRETLDAIFLPSELESLRRVGSEIDRLNSLDISGTLERQTQSGAIIGELVDRGRTADISRLSRLAPVGSARRATIRAGMVERIAGRVVDRKEGVASVNQKALRSEIEKLRSSGAIRLLEANDVRMLKNLDRVLDFIPASADAGTSIQAAETAAGLRGLGINAIVTFLENVGTGRAMTNPVFQRAILGAGKDKVPFNSIRVLGAALAQTNIDLEKSEDTSGGSGQ